MSIERNNHEGRLQRLEELLYLAFGSAGSSSLNTFAGPIVANQAAAQALSLADGKEVLTLAQEAIWQKLDGVPGVTPGVPPLAADEVIATTDGTGVLARTNYSSPRWRVGVNNIFINSVTGNNQNDGFTAGTAIQTGMELYRRWGWGTKHVIGPNLATSPDGFLNINVQNNLASPDQLPIRGILAANASLRIVSPLLAANVLRMSTLTAAPTAMNRAAPLGGTRLRIQDNTLANWAAFEVANRRVRFTNGPAAGGVLQVQTDVLAAPGDVDCTGCFTVNEAGFSQVPTSVTPANGNTYVVESLVVVNLGEIDIDQELNPSFGGFNVFINLVNINLPSMGLQFWDPRLGQGVFLNFYQCTVDRVIRLRDSGDFTGVASLHTDAIQTLGNIGAVFRGGGINRVATTAFPLIQWGAVNSGGGLDNDFVANQMAIFLGGSTSLRNCASWNVPAGGSGNTGGHGFLVGIVGAFGGGRSSSNFVGTAWGAGNAGAGILVGAACKGVGASQNATGTQGDFKLANNPVVGGFPVFFNAATSTYLGLGGVAGAAGTTSWANLAAAKPAGFGGGAHFPDQDASWVAAETTA